MLMKNRQEVRDALRSDFGEHPDGKGDLVETLGPAGRAMYVASQLEKWMAPEERYMDPQHYGNSKAYIAPQAKGVIGNLVPFNFPFELSLGPLVEMLAAGNRVIMKPSDMTPACGELIKKMIGETFEKELVAVVTGGLDLAKEFGGVRWDHLLYTGSPAVGRVIMAQAAKNLVPVTLELGGKCPAILTPNALNTTSVQSIIGTKLIKNGQMCISVDTVHLPKSQIPDFLALALEHFKSLGAYCTTSDCTGIISERHLDRLTRLLDAAKASGAQIVELEPGATVNRKTRQMPLTIVVNPSEDLELMQEEIFGPILPIRGYENLDEVIEYINARERPLGLYVFGNDDKVNQHVLSRTTSGGACINTCAVQGSLPSLGFGGSGMSGMGRHHGIDGFREFSNPRGVVVKGDQGPFGMLYPPYSTAVTMADHAFAEAAKASA